MNLDGKSLDQLTSEDIGALIPDVAEGRRIDYKESMPGDGERAVRDFLKDVCAMANAAGGYLVFGIDEERDGDGNSKGTPKSVVGVGEVNTDVETLKWQQRINQNIEPTVIGHRIRFIDGFADEKSVMLVYVPKSLLSPHRVTYQGKRDFYVRHDRGNMLMEIDELRSAFVDARAIPERIEEFRRQRVSRILAGETPVPLLTGFTTVMHVVPLAALGPEPAEFDVGAIEPPPEPLPPNTPYNSRLNFDGRLFHTPHRSEPLRSYSQVFRDGRVEYVDSREREPNSDGVVYIPSQTFESESIRFLINTVSVLDSLGVQPPLYVCLSLLRVRGMVMGRPRRMLRDADTAIDKDNLLVAPVMLADMSTENIDVVLRPAFDTLWQASNGVASPYYNNDGKWESRG